MKRVTLPLAFHLVSLISLESDESAPSELIVVNEVIQIYSMKNQPDLFKLLFLEAASEEKWRYIYL